MILFLLSIFFTIPAFAADTDAWLNDWDYYIYSSSATDPIIRLKGYKGESPEAHVYGRANLDGVSYRIYIWAYESNHDGISEYVSTFNKTETTEIEDLYFHAVDGDGAYVQNGSSADGLFWEMPSLKSIHFGDGIDFSNAYYGKWMFYGDTSLVEVDFGNLDLSRMVIATSMFEGASALKEVTISYSVGTNFGNLFKDCVSLEKVNITTNTPNPSWIKCSGMFKGCSSLKEVTMTGFNTGGTANSHASMFMDCTSLESFDFSQLDMSSATDCSYMFSGCESLKSLDLTKSSWSPDGVDLTGIAEGCTGLTELTVNPDLTVSDSTAGVGYVSTPTKLKVIGELSDSFNAKIMGSLKECNRYLEALGVRAGITLVGNDAYDRLSYCLNISDGSNGRIQDNDGSDSIYFNAYDHGIYIYEPGEYTLTLTQGIKVADTDTGGETVEALAENDDGFRCGDSTLTKTINVTRNDDGSISIEEI